MQEQTTLEKLGQKVSQMLRDYDALRMENADLKETSELLTLDLEAKDASITQMQEELQQKDRDIEEIVNKIESILG